MNRVTDMFLWSRERERREWAEEIARDLAADPEAETCTVEEILATPELTGVCEHGVGVWKDCAPCDEEFSQLLEARG